MARKKIVKKAVNKKAARKKSVRKTPAGKIVEADALLVELGTEELPPKALRRLSAAFADAFMAGLKDAGLLVRDDASCESFAAPRRLALRVAGVRFRQPDQQQERRGPALKAAYDDKGEPTRALLGFCGSLKIRPDKLETVETDKGTWVTYRFTEKGQAAKSLIPDILDAALKKLPIPKRMRWGDLDAEFVRPVHWLLILHGDKQVPAELLSVRSGRTTRGHRFHAPRPLRIQHAKDYEKVLKRDGKVIADFAVRRDLVRNKVEALAKKSKGKAVIKADLLDEVTSLVEWPEPLLGSFDEMFLDVPAEALMTSMQDHQKYFPVVSSTGKLKPCFITVANIKSRAPTKVREGNERVLRARFSDAQFFWDTDRKSTLAGRTGQLKDVVFHIKLGTMHDKVERISRVAGHIARELNVDAGQAIRAAQLSKADLLTGMVGEFPELQGTMGRYYALHDGEPAEMAAALEEQYQPRHAGDALPGTPTGQVLAIADRVDTLVGIFSVGELPTGDKDPFALRRAALGALRVMIEGHLELDLWTLLRTAAAEFNHDFSLEEVCTQVYDFMMERLRAYYGDKGVAHDVFESVLACRPSRPADFDRRLRAVTAFLKLKEAESLAAANKRIHNILRQGGTANWDHVSEPLLQAAQEKALNTAVAQMEHRVAPLFTKGDYTTAMKQLAALRPQVDAFFDHVMVMVDEEAVRDNRFALLDRVRRLFLHVADLSKIQG